VDHPHRFIYLALAIAWSILRVIRYARTATARRPGPAIPPSGGALEAATAAGSARSPLGPVETGGGLAGILAAVGVFIAGNVVIWPLLFLIPALEAVPESLRLIAGVLANLCLLYLARSVCARVGSSQPGVAGDNNPIK
jgi:hypothetical protein